MKHEPRAMNHESTYGAPDSRFKVFHDLMSKKVERILLISSTYDAWMMEEDCRLSERIVNEYRGLNLSRPPRLVWVSSSEEAMAAVDKMPFDLVIVMAGHVDDQTSALGHRLKSRCPQVPAILLCHNMSTFKENITTQNIPGFDHTFYWSGNTDLLVALIKSVEDRKNIVHDTHHAGIRVILLVEDSPVYISSLLPILYRELVVQVQSVIEEGLNEEHRLLAMRARPKILVAGSYEEAIAHFENIKPYVLGVISDLRYPRNGRLDDRAGVELLKKIHEERFDIPLLLISSEPSIANAAAEIPASFTSKHSLTLHEEIHNFFLNHLGFGPFVFKTPEGQEISRAANLRTLEQQIGAIDQDAFAYHCNRNDFSRWFFARAEIELADKVRPIHHNSFSNIEKRRGNLLSIIRERRMQRQKGLVVNFEAGNMDMDTEFFKIGKGSMGGKARGLAFVSSFLSRNSAFGDKYPTIRIKIPQTMVITAEGFDDFIDLNHLKTLSKSNLTDEQIAERFRNASLPQWILENLKAFLEQITYPLAVRSSGLLEDAQTRAYAGLYSTYMLPNDASDLQCRLDHLCQAIKLVYASTFFEDPKRFAQRVGHRTEEEKMAVIIQQLTGQAYGPYFYPDISGVAQSYNYYPFSKMKPEEGIVAIVAGLGKTAMDGGQALRFSPAYPKLSARSTTVDDILKNAQWSFYALKLKEDPVELGIDEDITLVQRQISEAADEPVINFLCGTYSPQEHRIRQSHHCQGHSVLTFDNILKFDHFPLAEILEDLLAVGQEAMGCPVEIEFSVNLCHDMNCQPDFSVLQLRPMGARQDQMRVDISPNDVEKAFCFSTQALGNGLDEEISDIVYLKPDAFDVAFTLDMVQEIAQINARLLKSGRRFLLVGPGRWGSADRWLGIPVRWADISGVGAIIETACAQLKAEPSQGSHFFHNLTSLGINYLNVTDKGSDFLHWSWLTRLPTVAEDRFVAHVRLDTPLRLKVDGRSSRAVLLLPPLRR